MINPPIGANLWIWDSPVTADVIRKRAPQAKALGFDAIELPLEDPSDWSASEVQPILEETGLRASVCAAMGLGRDLTSLNAHVIASTQDYLRACIDHAVGIGATIVAGPMYSPTGQTGPIDDFRWVRHANMQTLTPTPRGQILDVLIRSLSPLILYAGERGIRLAIEPLNRFETSLFNTVKQTLRLIEMVNHPSLGLLLDTFHMNIEERDIGEAIRHAGKKLFHFHASGNDRGAPGNDGIDWLSVRGALDDIGYSGMVSIESFTSANRTIATAASIWRPLAPSQDALAKDGLAFLRELFT